MSRQRILQWLCALIGHGPSRTRIDDGPWVCDRCGGFDTRVKR